MRCALVLTGLADIEQTRLDRVDGKAIECYPSAALYRFGFSRAELRNAKTDQDVRGRLRSRRSLERATWLTVDAETEARLALVGHSFDAFIAALVARAVVLGLPPPPSQLAALAAAEG